MSDRTHGYVIRWPVSNGYEYQGMHTTPNSDIQRAEVMSLAVASRFLRGGGYESAQIVRVRRVEDELEWDRLPDGLYRIGPANDVWKPSEYTIGGESPYVVERQVSDAPHWEIDPEDEP